MPDGDDDSGTESDNATHSASSVDDDDATDRKRPGAAQLPEQTFTKRKRRQNLDYSRIADRETKSSDDELTVSAGRYLGCNRLVSVGLVLSSRSLTIHSCTADPTNSGLIATTGYNTNEGVDPNTSLFNPLRASVAPNVSGGAAGSNLSTEASFERALESNRITGFRGGIAGTSNDALSQAIALQHEIDRRRLAMQLTALRQQQLQQQPPASSSSLFNNPYLANQDALLSQQLLGSAMGAQAGVRSDIMGGAIRLDPSAVVGSNPYSLAHSATGLVPTISSLGAAVNEGGLPALLTANQNVLHGNPTGIDIYRGMDPATALVLQRLQRQQATVSNVANTGLSTDLLSQRLRESASASLLPPNSLGRYELSSANPTTFPQQQQQQQLSPQLLPPQQQNMRVPEPAATNVASAASPSVLAERSQAMPPCAPLAPDGFPFRLPAILARPDDSSRLSSHQLLLRYQIEVFQATDDDINTHTRGRNKPIALSQVGLRCRHCASLPVAQRKKGSTYFPATLMGIYQAAQNMSTTHMQCGLCHKMPEDIKTLFARLLPTKVSSTGAGRQAWAVAGQKLGLVDTKEGIYFIRQVPPGAEVVPSNFRTTTTTTGTGASARKSPPPA